MFNISQQKKLFGYVSSLVALSSPVGCFNQDFVNDGNWDQIKRQVISFFFIFLFLHSNTLFKFQLLNYSRAKFENICWL